MSKRIVHVVTNVDSYGQSNHPTGLWLSELAHAYDAFEEAGFRQSVISPKGGPSPLEPRSLRWPMADVATKRWLSDPARRAILASTLRTNDVVASDFDVIYFTGGHGVMWDFPDCNALSDLTRGIYERGGVVASVCHGYCGLLNVRLSNGPLLVTGRRVTGYAWTEEVLAGVANLVPYNVEALMKERGAVYERAMMPFFPKVVVDGRLVSGQNPASAKGTAKAVIALLV